MGSRDGTHRSRILDFRRTSQTCNAMTPPTLEILVASGEPIMNARQIIQEVSDALSECITPITLRRRQTGRHAGGRRPVT
jgi:hypothetical protein